MNPRAFNIDNPNFQQIANSEFNNFHRDRGDNNITKRRKKPSKTKLFIRVY